MFNHSSKHKCSNLSSILVNTHTVTLYNPSHHFYKTVAKHLIDSERDNSCTCMASQSIQLCSFTLRCIPLLWGTNIWFINVNHPCISSDFFKSR